MPFLPPNQQRQSTEGTTDTKPQRVLAVNKKNLILANITMNDERGQERKGGV